MLRSVSPAFEELQKRLLQEQQLNKEQKEKLMQPRERENKNYNKSMVPKKQDLNQERILLIKKHAAMEIEEQALKEELKALQKEIEEKNFMTKQESYVQTQENDAKPGSQDTIAEIDCFIEKSKKTFIHENLETDANTDSSGKTANSKSILELDEPNGGNDKIHNEGRQMAEMARQVELRMER